MICIKVKQISEKGRIFIIILEHIKHIKPNENYKICSI